MCSRNAQGTQVTETQDLVHEIQSVREIIAAEWQDLEQHALTDRERRRLRVRIEAFAGELARLLTRLDELDNASRP
jgi:hypothetical protein